MEERRRSLLDIIGIGIDVLFFYTPEGLAIFRMELESYLNQKGWYARWATKMRRR